MTQIRKILSRAMCRHIYERWKDPIFEQIDRQERAKTYVYKLKCTRCGKEMFIRTW